MTADTPAAIADYVPRCGDHVLHEPSGETWVVAYASRSTNCLAWAGWPDGRALLSDCTIVKRCTDKEHRKAVDEWRKVPINTDSRPGNVLHFYSAELAKEPGHE